MATPSQSYIRGIPLPPGTKGLNFKDALAAMDSAYSPWSYNSCAENGFVRLRYGMSQYGTTSSGANVIFCTTYPAANGNDKIITVGIDTDLSYKAWDMTGGGSIATTTVINNFNTNYWFGNTFSGSLFVFESTPAGALKGARYDGVTWFAISYTYVNVTNPQGAASYKGRQYIIDRTTLKYDYSDIGAVQGATLHGVDLTTVFAKGGSFSWIASFCNQDGVANETYLAFGSTSGEVLIFGGDYPGADNWSIVARYIIGHPASIYPYGFSNVVEYQSDALIITSTGLVSLRQLMQQGGDAAINQTVSSYIDAYWSYLYAAQQSTPGPANKSWGGVFYPDQKKIVIYTNGIAFALDSVGNHGSTFFILNIVTGSWSVYILKDGIGEYINKIIYANKFLFFVNEAANAFTKGLNKFEDPIAGLYDYANYPYNYEINSAWNNFGNQVNLKKVSAFETLVHTDLNRSLGFVKCKTSSDFSVRTSQNCDVAADPGYQRISYNSGLDGTYFQYKISGVTNNISFIYELYGVNAILQLGGVNI